MNDPLWRDPEGADTPDEGVDSIWFRPSILCPQCWQPLEIAQSEKAEVSSPG